MENSSALVIQHKIVNIYADNIVCKEVEEKVTEKSNIKKFPKKKCLQKKVSYKIKNTSSKYIKILYFSRNDRARKT